MNPLNREAGAVPVPAEMREIAAALHAAEVLWAAFPYFRWRYGDRGRRFGHSDAAYLLTRVEDPWEVFENQVLWLSGVLAARGMPSLLLEQQLRVLHRVCVRELRHAARFAPLERAAGVLRARRRTWFDDATMIALGERFAVRAGFPAQRRVTGTGHLLVYAVADECNGAEAAVEKLASWLMQEAIFPPAWITAVRELMEHAQQR